MAHGKMKRNRRVKRTNRNDWVGMPKPQPEHERIGKPGATARCPDCGKTTWSTRKLAAAALADHLSRTGEPREDYKLYRCNSGNGAWHYGHEWGLNHQRGLPPRKPPRNRRLSSADSD